MSFAISGDNILARVDQRIGENIVPSVLLSDNGGESFGRVEPIDLSAYGPTFTALPASSPPINDYLGYFHAPILMADDSELVALNYVHGEALVEAIRTPRRSSAAASLMHVVFPKAPGRNRRFGNGITDGTGIIAVLQSAGRLLSSNSQAGGIHFPDSVQLNHEMLPIGAFTATECYTSGTESNSVSMDYVYVEGDADGRPRSRIAYVETWDMPLPEPEIAAVAVGTDVQVDILRDAHFEPGHVTFEFDDPEVGITGIEVKDSRVAIVHTDSSDLPGKIVHFVNKSIFYHHAACTRIESRD